MLVHKHALWTTLDRAVEEVPKHEHLFVDGCQRPHREEGEGRGRKARIAKFLVPFFFFFYLTYSRWTSSLPSCLWSQRIFPSLPGSRLTIFLSRCKSSTLTTRQPIMVEFYYGRDTLNDNGELLLSFANNHALAIANTFFSTPKGGVSHTFNGRGKKTIDYM